MIKKTADQKRTEWLERRRKGIGASDSPKILGLSDWGSALSVFNEKTGRAIENEMTERMEIGLEIEELVAHLFKKKMMKKIRRRNSEIYSKEHEYIFATIDRDICNEKSILECKNIGIYNEKWHHKVPDIYYIQCQHQMYATGADLVYLAALFGGNHFEVYEIARDKDTIDWIVNNLVDFWQNYIIPGNPPLANRNDSKFLTDKFPIDNGEIIESTEAHSDLIREYNNLKLIIDKSSKRKDDISNQLKQFIGANRGFVAGNYRATWSRWNTARLDLERLKLHHPLIFKEYLVESPSGRLTISKAKD